MLPEWLTKPDPSIYRSGSYIVLDFETTNIEKGDPHVEDNQIVLAYWTVVRDGRQTNKHCFGNELHQAALLKDIQSVDFIVAQNAKFELGWLARCGLDLRSVLVYDTMIAEYVIHGNKKVPLDEDSIAKRYKLGSKNKLVSRLIKMGICPSTIPRKWLLRYCGIDVHLCHDIFKKQLDKIESYHPPLLNVVYTRCLLTPVLADIEGNGMTLDPERVKEVREEYLAKLAEVDEELYELNPDINWNSPKQKAEYLYDTLGFSEPTDFRGEILKTPSGGRKTDTDTITQLKATNATQEKVVSLITERNKYASALSKNLDFFYGVCEEYGNVFRGVFNQCVTSTHRLSSSGRKLTFNCLDGKSAGAQFQNLPRHFKRLLTSSGRDRVIGEGDGSQLEFRVAGHLGRDEQVYYDITHGVDIHAFTASTLTNAGEPTSRQDAKASTFRPLYGGSSGTPAIQKYCKAFRTKYQSLSDTQEQWARDAVSTKRLVTEWGMVYYFPKTRVSSTGYIEGSTQIYNFPIQAFATAEIIPIALVYFWHRIKGHDIKIVNTVHDSIICDMDKTEVNNFSRLMALSMIDDAYFYLRTVYGVEMSVPLGVGVKVGSHWNEADTSLAPMITLGLEDAGYEVVNEDDEEFKCDAHKRLDK